MRTSVLRGAAIPMQVLLGGGKMILRPAGDGVKRDCHAHAANGGPDLPKPRGDHRDRPGRAGRDHLRVLPHHPAYLRTPSAKNVHLSLSATDQGSGLPLLSQQVNLPHRVLTNKNMTDEENALRRLVDNVDDRDQLHGFVPWQAPRCPLIGQRNAGLRICSGEEASASSSRASRRVSLPTIDPPLCIPLHVAPGGTPIRG